MSRRLRILFVAESVTLAQVVRLVTLAGRLDGERFDVHFACRDFEPLAFDGLSGQRWRLFSVDDREALQKIERGRRLYERDVLHRYVAQELELFRQVKPDLVVGDFRLSLSTSAALSGVPCATLINAYWSPFARREFFPMPDHPLVTLLGVARAERYYPRALPAAFRHFIAPLNEVRRSFGLPPFPGLLEALTDGDFTLYADIPELCPTTALPSHHRYLGAVPWSPPVKLPPAFWADLTAGAPLVYVTLGSSGRASALPAVLQAIERSPVVALLATAGRFAPNDLPPNVRVAPFVPGELACRLAKLVITNGGSSSGYQALAAGKPVLGIASNLDQYLAMTAIEQAGAGRLLRAGTVTAGQVCDAMQELSSSSGFGVAARALARAFSRVDCHERFARVIEDALNGEHRYANSS